MLNHFNFKEFGHQILLTNDVGAHAFISKEDFKKLLEETLPADSEIYKELENKYFVYNCDQEVFLTKILPASRFSKRYLFSATQLFIFVVTVKCNFNCVYCQAKSPDSAHTTSMTQDIAKRAVDIAFSSPSLCLDFEFQGGEPLLNFPVIKWIVEYANQKSIGTGKKIRYSIVTNLSLLNDDMVKFILKNGISICTSLDGNEIMHDTNRPFIGGEGTFKTVKEKIEKLRTLNIAVSAIETTTAQMLDYPQELVDTYAEMGFSSIFVRPLTPLGIAKDKWSEIGYTPEAFVAFYEAVIKYILELNVNGVAFCENHARIFLKKILAYDSENYMELRSPCGASIGQMAFYYNGDIFTCDEGRMLAEMGNPAFKLGNVYDDYDKLITNPICKAVSCSSVLESIPCCCDCVFQPYCGTCPVINFVMDSDIITKTPNNYRCRIYSGMLDFLFELLQTKDDNILKNLNNWINDILIKQEK